MSIAKTCATWLWTQIKNEVSIKRPPAAVMAQVAREKKAKSGDALKGILILIIAPVIFVILAAMIL